MEPTEWYQNVFKANVKTLKQKDIQMGKNKATKGTIWRMEPAAPLLEVYRDDVSGYLGTKTF